MLQRAPGLQGLHILPFVVAAYNKKKGAMEFIDEKHKDDYLFISGACLQRLMRRDDSVCAQAPRCVGWPRLASRCRTGSCAPAAGRSWPTTTCR